LLPVFHTHIEPEMTSSLSRVFALVGVVATVAACHPGVSVGSPAPGAGPAAAAKSTGVPSSITTAMIDSGKTLFAGANCAKCHGAGGVGAQNGPNLTDATWVQIDGSYDAIVNIIHTGVPAANIKGGYRFNMRPMGGATFTDDQVRMIAAYVYTISHK
jgi:mono/diheme cytochrome c family protein